VRILVVDDEVKLVRALRRGLEREGHAVDVAGDSTEALHQASQHDYDAVLLDVMLPGTDGVEVCRTLRARGRWVPILMLTARDAVGDRVRGLDAGADDYLIKPFAFAELLARLRALLRRGAPERPARLRVADVELDPATRTVTRAGRPVELSPSSSCAVPARWSTGARSWSTSGTTTTTGCPTSWTCTSGTCGASWSGRSTSR